MSLTLENYEDEQRRKIGLISVTQDIDLDQFESPGEWSNGITNLLDPSLDASGLFCRDNGDGTIVLDGRIYSPTTTVIMNTGHIIFRMPIAPDTQRTISAYIHADSGSGVYGRITEARVHLNVKTNGDIEFIGAVNATGASQIIQYTSMYFNYTLIRK